MRAICHERPGCRCPWSAKSDLREFASDFGRTGTAALCFYGVPCAGRAQPRPLIRGFILCSGRAQPRPLSAALLFKLPVACGQPRSESVNMKTSAVNHAYVSHGTWSRIIPSAGVCLPPACAARPSCSGRLGRRATGAVSRGLRAGRPHGGLRPRRHTQVAPLTRRHHAGIASSHGLARRASAACAVSGQATLSRTARGHARSVVPLGAVPRPLCLVYELNFLAGPDGEQRTARLVRRRPRLQASPGASERVSRG